MVYTAYNLRIRSDVPLPELTPGDSDGDVTIRLETPGPLVSQRTLTWQDSPRAFAVMAFPEVGTFVLSDGSDVTITPDPRVDLGLLRLYIQGMVLAAILHQRGFFVLHSSVVNIAGATVAFIGPVGAGKSSTAAALHARGNAIVADDNAAIDVASEALLVSPAFPVLKLYPAIAESLGYGRDACMHESHGKQAQAISTFSAAPAPLKAVYLLDRESPLEICELSTVEAVTEFIRHSVPSRWGATGDGNHLRMCARLAAKLPVYRVRSFSSLEELPRIAARIEQHAAWMNSHVDPCDIVEPVHA